MSRMCLLLFLIVQIVASLGTNENGIIWDYFSYKKVNRIAVFSCSDLENDFKFARMFNDTRKMYISISNPNSMLGSAEKFQTVLNADYHRLGIFLDLRCDTHRYTRILNDAVTHSMYDEMHKWLLFGFNLNYTLQLLNDGAFSILTDVAIILPSRYDYILYDVYNPCKDRGGSMNVTLLGTWNNQTGLSVSLNQSKFERRSNLHGMKLKVGIVVSHKPENVSLHDMMIEYSLKARYGRSKFLYVLLLHIADLFNFTMDFVQIDTQKKFDNSGPVFTAFQQKIVDFSSNPVTMKVDRLNNGDIIGPVWPIRSCFLFRTISSSTMKTAQFLKPLSVKVWYTILGTIGIATLALIILLRLEGVHSPTETCGISVLITIGALSQQGSTFVPVHYAGRIAFLQIMLFSIIILHYYSASVVSDRLKNIGEKMNDSLISLSKSNIKIAVEPTPYIRSFLQTPDEEVKHFYHKRWSKIPESNRYLSLEEGLDRVAEGNLAYHTMIDSAYPYIERTFNDRSICELTEVHLFRKTLAFYARHQSPFTELLKVGLTKIHNVGIRKRQLKRWAARKPYCPNNLRIAEPLSIHEAAPVFIFLCISTGLSILVSIMEHLVYWIWLRRESNYNFAKRRLIAKNINIQPLKNINLQMLKNLHSFRNWMEVASP